MKRAISIFLALALIISAGLSFPMEVSATGEKITATVQGTYTKSAETQDVTIRIETPGVTEDYCTFGIANGTTLPEGFKIKSFSTNNTSPTLSAGNYIISDSAWGTESYGKLTYEGEDAENTISADAYYDVVIVAPANAVGTYNVTFNNVRVFSDYGSNELAIVDEVTATFTISEPVQVEDYEIYYTLSGSSFNGTGDSDGYTDYNIGDTVTATVWIKNNTGTAVSLQAYDIYLTHDSKLTAGEFTPENDDKGARIATDNSKLHIQAIGENTSTAGVADININLPADGSAVELGSIPFTINDTTDNPVVYDGKMFITLADNSEAKSQNSTNISIANIVDGEDVGNKISYYPAVIGDVLGAEVMTTYTVTYDANGGSFAADAVTTQTKQHNIELTIAAPATPTREGFSFMGWSTESGDNNEVYAPATYTANEDKILYAVWQQDNFTVTWYQSDNTTVHQTDTIASGTVGLTAPSTNPEKTDTDEWDYSFIGWNTDKTATTGADLTQVTVTGNLELYPIYSSVKQAYSVTWYNYDGTQLHKDENVEYGTTPTYDGQTPTKPDSTDGQFEYTHDGWSATKGGDKLEPMPAVDGNEEFYAVFKETTKSYTVTYAAGDHGSFAADAVTEESVLFNGKPANAPEVTEATGYIFTGWSDGTTTSENLSDFTVTGDVTLTAQYAPASYTITLNPNGGTVSDMTANTDGNYTMEYDITSTTTLPTATKTGYAFDGWKLETAVDGWEANTYGANTSVTGKWGNVTLVAQWTEDKHEVKQSANVENGTATPDVNSAKEGDTVTVTVSPAEGYEFIEDTNTVTYTYTDTNNTQHTETIDVIDEDGDGIYTGTFGMPDYPVEITATFTAIDYTINVTVEPTGYATVTPSKATANVNDEITLTASDIKDGYQLKGYKVVNDSTSAEIKVTDGMFTMPAANVTVTATFEGKPYTITYDSNGGENSMGNIEGTFGTATTLTTNAFVKTGYTFAGWSTTEGGTTVEYADGASFNPTTYAESYTLHAVWTANADTKYTVNHWQQNINGGDEQNSDNYTLKDTEEKTGTTATEVTPEFKTYIGFTAPTAKQTVTIAADGSTVVNYYYTRDTYTISLDENGGSYADGVTEPTSYEYGTSVTLPTPTKPGYDFDGWYDADNKVESITATDTGDKTLTAQWTAHTYTITFNVNEGDDLTGAAYYETNKMYYDIEDSLTLPTPTRAYYTFTGWKVTTADGNWAENAEISTTNLTVTGKYGDVTLTAQWNRAVAPVAEEYKYSANGYYMIRVAAGTLAETQEYQFNGESMYYIENANYAVNGDNKVFYSLVEAKYVDTATKTLNDTGYELLTVANCDARSAITYDGKINDDSVVNIADANIVYQMIVNGGGYYGDLEVPNRLAADMNKETADASVQRATIADVNAIVNIINGTTTTN